jgi:hypothetical protein
LDGRGAFMNDEMVYRPLECLTSSELGMLQRMATRYSEIARERAYLVGLMNLAVRTEDAKLLATARERLAEAEFECSQCSSAMRVLGRELLSAAAEDSETALVGVAETCEFATA